MLQSRPSLLVLTPFGGYIAELVGCRVFPACSTAALVPRDRSTFFRRPRAESRHTRFCCAKGGERVPIRKQCRTNCRNNLYNTANHSPRIPVDYPQQCLFTFPEGHYSGHRTFGCVPTPSCRRVSRTGNEPCGTYLRNVFSLNMRLLSHFVTWRFLWRVPWQVADAIRFDCYICITSTPKKIGANGFL